MQLHHHYSSDNINTTARKDLFNLLLMLGIHSARRRGFPVYFHGVSLHVPGAYMKQTI